MLHARSNPGAAFSSTRGRSQEPAFQNRRPCDTIIEEPRYCGCCCAFLGRDVLPIILGRHSAVEGEVCLWRGDAPCYSIYFVPDGGISIAGVAQLVEHLICNQRVGGSNPFASSTTRPRQRAHRVALFLRERASPTAFSRSTKVAKRKYVCGGTARIVDRWPSG
jgi:hypothetical protein